MRVCNRWCKYPQMVTLLRGRSLWSCDKRVLHLKRSAFGLRLQIIVISYFLLSSSFSFVLDSGVNISSSKGKHTPDVRWYTSTQVARIRTALRFFCRINFKTICTDILQNYQEKNGYLLRKEIQSKIRKFTNHKLKNDKLA